MEQCQYQFRPITTIDSLCKALGKSKEELLNVADWSDHKKYRKPKTPVFKKDGTTRNIMAPCRELRSIQFRINRSIFKNGVKWPSYLFGSIPNSDTFEEPRDYIKAASYHCGSKSICTLDVSDFFDNVHYDHIYDIFRRLLHFSEDISHLLCRLVTYNEHLVQGALTSSYLAMLVLWEKEPELVSRLSKKTSPILD